MGFLIRVLRTYWTALTLPYRVVREEWRSLKQSLLDPDPYDWEDEDDDPIDGV